MIWLVNDFNIIISSQHFFVVGCERVSQFQFQQSKPHTLKDETPSKENKTERNGTRISEFVESHQMQH
jgi:hypothetical protein